MILKISLMAKAGVPKTLVKQKLRLHSLYFPRNTLTLTVSRGEFSDFHSIFRLRALQAIVVVYFHIRGVTWNCSCYQYAKIVCHDGFQQL